jgi:hypothetical protein
LGSDIMVKIQNRVSDLCWTPDEREGSRHALEQASLSEAPDCFSHDVGTGYGTTDISL